MRKLQPELINYFEERLKDNDIYLAALDKKLPRLLMVEAARTLVGTKETGFNRGRIVELLQKTCQGLPGWAYCMYTVQSCIAFAELKTGLKSPLKASGSCADVFKAASPEMYVKNIPAAGAVAIWYHERKDGSYGGGHTGQVLSADDQYVYLVEGNTSSAIDSKGEIIREGEGIHLTRRPLVPTGSMKLRKYLKPF